MATTVTTTPIAAADRHHRVADGDIRDHVHGEMIVRDHERTFEGFVKFMTWSAVLALVVLVFLALAGA